MTQSPQPYRGHEHDLSDTSDRLYTPEELGAYAAGQRPEAAPPARSAAAPLRPAPVRDPLTDPLTDPMPGSGAPAAADRLAALIDGFYLREALGVRMPDGAAAIAQVLAALDKELA